MSNWLIDAMPARTPTGIFLKIKLTTRMIPVPVISIGEQVYEISPVTREIQSWLKQRFAA